jgi:hypothetical protein
MISRRPYPPPEVLESFPSRFIPSPDLNSWARSTFIAETAQLANPDHFHLNQAEIGFLWTNEPNERRGKMVLGMCQLMPPSGDKWAAGRAISQIEEWFGDMPDFLITLFAPVAADMDDASFMALVEHELYHAAQAVDKFGQPKFSKETSRPVWAMRSHDVEQFVGVVRRYGADAAMVREMVSAANKGPEIAAAKIAAACGNCLRLVKA